MRRRGKNAERQSIRRLPSRSFQERTTAMVSSRSPRCEVEKTGRGRRAGLISRLAPTKRAGRKPRAYRETKTRFAARGGSAAFAVAFKAYPTVIEEIPAALSERLVDQDAGEGFRFSRQTKASVRDDVWFAWVVLGDDVLVAFTCQVRLRAPGDSRAAA